jgi:hypothetical protein
MVDMSIRATTATRFRSSSRRFGLILAVGIAAAASARAAPQRCPEGLQVEQRAVNVPSSFQVFEAEARHKWVSAQFSDGPPSEQAWLAPDSSRKSGASFISVWQLSPGSWLACGYTGTSLVAAFRLPDSVHTCEVRYDTTFSPPAATAIDCR